MSLNRRAALVKSLLFLAVLVGRLVTPLFAHDIITTKLAYTRDISRIFARHCLSCHAAGSSIPLTSYDEVRPWAVAIKEQVLARSMPPWGAVKGFGEFSRDDSLTQEDILLVAAWVVGGAPQGSPTLLPTKQLSPHASPYRSGTDAFVVSTRQVLKKPLTIAGIRPQPHNLVASARITARLPNGQVEPLLWLYHYDPKWQTEFRFRHPLKL